MIITKKNNTYYTLILDLEDLKNFNIKFINFLGNSKNTFKQISSILEKLKIKKEIKSINITTFKFKIFKINISLYD